MDKRLVAAALGALVVGAVAGYFMTGLRAPRGGSNPVMYARDGAQGCAWVSKEDGRVRGGGTLTVVIRNECLDDIRAGVGNFRHAATSTATDCSAPGPDFPFDDPPMQSEDRRTTTVPSGETRVINFKRAIKGTNNSYYYDLCIGGRVLDPRLVVE